MHHQQQPERDGDIRPEVEAIDQAVDERSGERGEYAACEQRALGRVGEAQRGARPAQAAHQQPDEGDQSRWAQIKPDLEQEIVRLASVALLGVGQGWVDLAAPVGRVVIVEKLIESDA